MARDGKTEGKAFRQADLVTGVNRFFGKQAIEKVLELEQVAAVKRARASLTGTEALTPSKIRTIKSAVELTDYQKYVVTLEGYVDGFYHDDEDLSKATMTRYTGQTGKYMDMTFKESYDKHIVIMRDLLPKYDDLKEGVRKEMISYVYRGDLGFAHNMRKELNKTPPDYKAAFLAASNWDEKNYYDKDALTGVKARKLRAMTAIGKAAGLDDDAIELRIKTVADFLKQDKEVSPEAQTKEERNNAKTRRLESYSDPVIRKLMADPKIGKKTLGYLEKGEYGKAAAEVVNYGAGRTAQPISIKHQGLIQGVIDARPTSSLDTTTSDTYAANTDDVANMTRILNQSISSSETQGDRLAAIDLDINAEDANNWLSSLNGGGQEGYQQQGLRTV